MKKLSPNRARAAAGMLWCAAAVAVPCAAVWGQARGVPPEAASARTELLDKAHALEMRGRPDLASQTWQQVLLVDPNSTEALAGLARAAKTAGRGEEAQRYLARLREIDPTDRRLKEIAGLPASSSPPVQLSAPGVNPAEVNALVNAGHPGEAMALLQQAYGSTPPPGEAAVLYYETDGATEAGRPRAVAALRALVDEFPGEARYQIALGKVLSRNPRTRAEGRRYLEQFPQDREAREALQQMPAPEPQSPGMPRNSAGGTSSQPQGVAGRVRRRTQTSARAPESALSRSAGPAPQRGVAGTYAAAPREPARASQRLAAAPPSEPGPIGGAPQPQPVGSGVAQDWLQVLGTMHSRGENAEAVKQAGQLPAGVRQDLESNPAYLQLMAAVYARLGDAGQAAALLRSAAQTYRDAHLPPPPELELRRASLLLMAGDDGSLYVQLMSFGGRSDLSDGQRREAQVLWVRWAMSRAVAATALGKRAEALAILNAAASSFRDNAEVLQMLAGGYVADGFAPEAVERFKAQALGSGAAEQDNAAIRAALAADDPKVAERLLQRALAQNPHDPRLLLLGARVEEARGDRKRALAYYHDAFEAMPDAAMSAPGPAPGVSQREELQQLLAPGADSRATPTTPGKPYLPSFAPGYAPLAPLQPQGVPSPLPPSLQ